MARAVTRPGLFFALVVVVACASRPPSAEPVLSADDFELTVQPSTGTACDEPVPIRYRLRNGSTLPVCLGVDYRLFVRDRPAETRIGNHGSGCQSPRLAVMPGDVATWRWDSVMLGCLKEAPDDFAASFPDVMCGAPVPVRARITVWRLEAGRPRGRALEIASAPISWELACGEAAAEK